MSDTTDILAGDAGRDVEPAAAPASGPTAGPISADAGEPTEARPRRRATGLSGMLLPELQTLASSLGISGTGRMRKGELVAAIQARQGGNTTTDYTTGSSNLPAAPEFPQGQLPPAGVPAGSVPADQRVLATTQSDAATVTAPAAEHPAREGRQRRAASRPAGSPGAQIADRTDQIDQAGRFDQADRFDQASGTERVDQTDRTDQADRIDQAGRAEQADRVGREGGDGDRRGERRERGESGAPPAVLDRPERDGDRDQRADRGGREGGDRSQRGDGDRGQRRDRAAGEGDRRGDRESGAQTTAVDRPERDGDRDQRADRSEREGGDRGQRADGDRGQRGERSDRDGQGDRRRERGDRAAQGGTDRQGGGSGQSGNQRNDQRSDQRSDRDDDDDFDGRGGSRRRGRFRDRRRNRNDRFGAETSEPVIAEDDVLLPVAGILDILDNYAFVRTSGYLTGPNDVYVSLAQVRRHGLRRGDAITGAVRQPREGERRDKYNALVRLDTVNGVDPEQAKSRPEFTKLTPLYPQDRLRLETEPHLLTPRIIDMVMPIGKGQRALIVSPPKAGKTMILQAIANAITTNNPETHLMVVLVDERPEEVTDMQRSVKGEVIASTFDRPPTDHTTVAELSIERAKRLVELGHDVVVLLDSITRLGRAYNLAAPASGRILSGGVDSTALYPPKRFLGAARNIEHGGSLTIFATALIETGSTMDTVIFEEFKGTGNAELVLSRKIADKRVFPAVDVIASGTRKEEILLAPEELVIVHKLRRVLNALDPQQAIDLLLDRLKQSRTNVEFLMQIAKSTPGQD